jgi:GNAT superfamily N-acetyltransferase
MQEVLGVRMSDDVEIEIRLVRSDDLPGLRALEDRAEGFVCDRRFTDAIDGDSSYYIAVRAEDPLGTVVLDLKPGPLMPELRNMYVYQHARRQGIGRLLDLHVETVARDLGYEPTGNHRIVGGDAPEGLPGEVFHDAIYRKRLRQF